MQLSAFKVFLNKVKFNLTDRYQVLGKFTIIFLFAMGYYLIASSNVMYMNYNSQLMNLDKYQTIIEKLKNHDFNGEPSIESLLSLNQLKAMSFSHEPENGFGATIVYESRFEYIPFSGIIKSEGLAIYFPDNIIKTGVSNVVSFGGSVSDNIYVSYLLQSESSWFVIGYPKYGVVSIENVSPDKVNVDVDITFRMLPSYLSTDHSYAELIRFQKSFTVNPMKRSSSEKR